MGYHQVLAVQRSDKVVCSLTEVICKFVDICIDIRFALCNIVVIFNE